MMPSRSTGSRSRSATLPPSTYYNSFVSDLSVSADKVAKLAARGQARWKIESKTFNVLKANAYNLDHKYGEGGETLARSC